MKYSPIILFFLITLLVGCGSKERVEIKLQFEDSSDSKVTVKQTMVVEKGSTVTFPTGFQPIGEYGVQSTAIFSDEEKISVLIRCGVDGNYESKEIELDYRVTKRLTFDNGVSVSVTPHRPKS